MIGKRLFERRMNEIIKVVEQNGKQAVSARELHVFLESKQEFANWMKNRIEKYGLVENQDFEVFDNFVKNPVGGRPLTEYADSYGRMQPMYADSYDIISNDPIGSKPCLNLTALLSRGERFIHPL